MAALLLLVIIRGFTKPRGRSARNEVIGWQITFLSTTYAVIIAFRLSDVWTAYQAAETHTEVEANSILNVYRLAEGLKPQDFTVVRGLARQYAELMLSAEWPQSTAFRTAIQSMSPPAQ